MKDFVISIAPLTHYGSTNLTQANTMSPPCTNKTEVLWDVIHNLTTLYYESRTVEMALAQRTSYL